MALSDSRVAGLKINEARLAVARQAAALFWKHGVDRTSGEAIAAASGLSKRTVWRYFRSKEACVEPLFIATGLRFVGILRTWPREVSIEAHLQDALGSMLKNEQEIEDGIAVARLITLLRTEPAIRSAYLMASAESEDELRAIIAERAGRSRDDFDVKICAAAAMAAVRVVDEDICTTTFILGHHVEHREVCDRMAAAIRAAASLPICDPVTAASETTIAPAHEDTNDSLS